VLNNLASVYKNMGNYKEAITIYNRALSLTEKVLGTDHPEAALALNNLASVYAAMGY